MAHILGRVTDPLSSERGPDALYELRLPGEWLEQGVSIEFVLPRRLTCAACEGGGCDACGRSGAVTARGEDEPAERVPVTLPKQPPGGAPANVVLRIPECGGRPPESRPWPRGLLLLRVRPGEVNRATVRRLDATDRRFCVEPGRPAALRPVALVLLVLAALAAAWWLGGL